MFPDAAAYYDTIRQLPRYPSHISPLDALLAGGFLPGLVYHLFGTSPLFSDLLLRITAEIAITQLTWDPPIQTPIYYVDARNHFSPHLLSQIAISHHLPAMELLEHIQLARAFNWNQLTEILSDHIPKTACNTLLIDGWTNFLHDPAQFPSHSKKNTPPKNSPLDSKPFHDLNTMITGLKAVLQHPTPLIITTGTLHEMSHYKAMGGNLVRHFAMVLIEITQTPSQFVFDLLKHPFLPERRIEIPIPKDPIPVRMRAKYNKINVPHNTTLDKFVKS